MSPCAAGVAITDDGQTIVVANYYNDSITVFTGGLGHWSQGTELDLRPGKSDPAKSGVPGGEYPFWVAVKGSGPAATAYVSSIRDREVVVASLGATPSVTTRIPLTGQPNKLTLNKAQTLLYVSDDQADTIDVIDTAQNVVLERIPVLANTSVLPATLKPYKGANPNSVTLSLDEKQLWVTLGTLNAVAVVALGGHNEGDQVVGLIPAGWYPNAVSFNGDGTWAYVVNGKSPTGANPDMYYSYGPPMHKNGYASNEYNPQRVKAGLQSYPVPAPAQLATLTSQVATNNNFSHTESASDAATMAKVQAGVKHVVFIIKENRRYDQVLGDATKGNGDPSLAEFGLPLTPNLHALAGTFVTLDNTYATAEGQLRRLGMEHGRPGHGRRAAPGAGHVRRARPQPGRRRQRHEPLRQRVPPDRRRAAGRRPADPVRSGRPARPGGHHHTRRDGERGECGLPVGRRAARQPYRARLRLLR